MENIREFLGCNCRSARALQSEEGSNRSDENKMKIPAHTFAWAKNQYVEDRPLWPTYQSLDLVLDIVGKEISGTNTIKFKTLQKDVTTFKIDSIDLKIHALQVNGKDVKFSVGERQIEVILPESLSRGATGEIKISYSCHEPKAGIYFIAPDAEYPNRPTQVWTQGQDDDARFWFPSFDEPRIKYPCEMKIEVPANFIATSNGALVSESKGGKTWTFLWKSSACIPSYLVTLTVGKFSEIRDDWRGKPVNYLFEKGRDAEARLSFYKTPQMMELFSKVTGVEYPYEKYSQITAAEFIFGGMENTSATTQTDSTLHPASLSEDFSSDDLVAHELAHQWFGDLVTCKSWAHGWLNEGWATFMETVFKEQDLGHDESQYYRLEEQGIYFDEDKRLYRRPIVSPFYADPGEVWDRHIYQKGGLVLNMLRAHIGHEDFWAGVKNYLNTFKGATAETIDFQRALEQTSGMNLQEFFDQWVFKGGYPELKAEFEWVEKNKMVKFKIKQKQKVTDLTPLFTLSNQIEFVMDDGTRKLFPIVFSEAEQTFTIPMATKPAYCRFDVGNTLIKDLDWSMPLEMIRNQLEKDSDVVGKIYALKSLTKDSSNEGVDILIKTLKTDAFWGVRAEAATAIGETGSGKGMQALISALKEEGKSKTRTKIAAALGKFRDEKAADALRSALEEDESLFVKGAAASALGKTKSKKAFDILEKTTQISSWNDYLAAQAYSGLRHLRDDRALPLFLSGSKYGAPKFARLACVSALGEYGLEKPEIGEFLRDALLDKFPRVRFMAAEALVKRKDSRAANDLEEVAFRSVEGHFKAAAFRAASRIRKNLQKPQELTEIRESLSKVLDENRKLKDRVQKLEASKQV